MHGALADHLRVLTEESPLIPGPLKGEDIIRSIPSCRGPTGKEPILFMTFFAHIAFFCQKCMIEIIFLLNI